MTSLAVVQRECDLFVARTTVLTFNIQKHRIVYRPFLGGWEYLWMADLAAIPYRMLFMGKLNRVAL